MLNSSIASSDGPQCKTATTFSEDRHRTRLIEYPFVIQYFPGVGRLHHVLRSLQHIINDNEHLAKIIPMLPLLAFKQPPNLKQTIVPANYPAFRTSTTIPHNAVMVNLSDKVPIQLMLLLKSFQEQINVVRNYSVLTHQNTRLRCAQYGLELPQCELELLCVPQGQLSGTMLCLVKENNELKTSLELTLIYEMPVGFCEQ
eukprot:g43054.t1